MDGARGRGSDGGEGWRAAHLAALDMMFCAAPTKTASMSGVVPSAASGAAKVEPVRQSAKKATPVARRTAGVIMAAVPQPHLRKTKRPKSIMKSVTTPVCPGTRRGGRRRSGKQRTARASARRLVWLRVGAPPRPTAEEKEPMKAE